MITEGIERMDNRDLQNYVNKLERYTGYLQGCLDSIKDLCAHFNNSSYLETNINIIKAIRTMASREDDDE